MGPSCQPEPADGVYALLIDGTTVLIRQARPDASLRHLLEPTSIAVVGANREPAGVGHTILRNILAAGFAGMVVVVVRARRGDRRGSAGPAG